MTTQPGEDGISEVFHASVLPADLVPEGLVDRWTNIVNASPITAITVTGKENLAVNSIWDEDSETFTMAEGMPVEAAKALNKINYVFLIDNIVNGILNVSNIANIPNPKYTAAFSAPVRLFALEDDSPVDLGYTWDGTTFTAPSDI